MLFICYIENAFKHGISYQQDSFIHIQFEMTDGKLHFQCVNSKLPERTTNLPGGLGLRNNENRLNLLFPDNFNLHIQDTEKQFSVTLHIPVS